MKHVTSFWKRVVGAGVLLGIVTLASAGPADGKGAKPKPYPLQTCVVSGEKFGGDMGSPHVFAYQGREIKLCCKSCLKDFNKEPAKFIKKLDEAEKAKTNTAPSKGHDGHGGHQH
jgi:hypothetical protein